MSGVYIKGMEMPTSCGYCRFRYDGICHALQKTQYQREDCPLIPVPPHGRLGDLDKLENGLRHMAKYQHDERQQGILGCCETIRLAHTIIPAEEGET